MQVASVVHAKCGAGRSGAVVVSDAVWVSGLPEGTYQWMGKDISLECDGETGGFVVRDPTEKCLAGSPSTSPLSRFVWCCCCWVIDEMLEVISE